MLEQVAFDLIHSRPGTALGIEIWIDNHCIYDHPRQTGNLYFQHNFQIEPGNHLLRLVLKNKTPFHTKIDSQNNIVSDCVITVENFCFNQIDVQKMLLDYGQYHVPNQNTVTFGSVAGIMAYNGEVILKFSSPTEDWMVLNFR